MEEKADKSLPAIIEDKPIDDPIELLELVRDAILRKSVDQGKVSKAVNQVLHKYEMQNRVFMIAAANAELPRIVRLLNFLTTCEEEMFDSSRISGSSTKELIRMYALAQSNLVTGLDNVKKVADMRLEMLRAGSSDRGVFEPEEDLDNLSKLPGLDSTSRDRVRKIVSGLVEAIDKDDSVEDYDEPTDYDTDD